MQKIFLPIAVLVGILVLAGIAGGIYYFIKGTVQPKPTPYVSTQPSTPAPEVCIQVITPAKNPQTGECKEFPTPCDVPTGWQTIQSCNSTPTACPTPPQCKGNLIYGDPRPDDPNQCPRYACLP